MESGSDNWILLAIIIFAAIFAIVAAVSISGMWKAAAQIDFLSAVRSYLVFFIVGVALLVIIAILVWRLRG